MRTYLLTASLLLLLPMVVTADSLSLRDGTRLEGDFLGGSPRELRFMVNGEIRTFGIEELDALHFGGSRSEQQAPPSSSTDGARDERQQAPEPSGGSIEVMLPAGTRLSAVILENLDSGLQLPGHRFEAALGEDISADGEVLIPTGSRLLGRVTQVEKADVSRPMGSLVLELTGIIVDGVESPIVTNSIRQSASADPAAAAEQAYQRGARAGATIGALSGGSYGSAQRGAVIGGMLGWGGDEPVQAVVFANTILEFSLSQELWLFLER